MASFSTRDRLMKFVICRVVSRLCYVGGLKEMEGGGAPSPCAAVSGEIKSPFRSFDILNNLSYFAQRHLDSQLPAQGDAAFFFPSNRLPF